MSETLAVGPVTLSTTGEQTGRFLGTGTSTVPGTFASLVRQTNNVVTYDHGTGLADYPNATLVIPPHVISNAPGQVVYPAGVEVAVAAGVNLITEYDIYGALASASPMTRAQSSSGNGTLIDVWGGSSIINEIGQNSTVAAGGADNSILMTGSNDQLFVDSGSSTTITETRAGNFASPNPYQYVGSNIIVIGSSGPTNPPPRPARPTSR